MSHVLSRSMTSLCCAVSFLLCTTACTTPNAKKDQLPTNNTTTTDIDGHLRLDDTVTPKEYTLDITIIPDTSSAEDKEAKGHLEGIVTIKLQINKPTAKIVMHAEQMTVSSASIVSEKASTPTQATPALGKNGNLTLTLPKTLDAGAYTLTLSYKAQIDELPEGLYRVKDGQGWYAFTQFEPLEAREAFPCFDEPRFKTPYNVSISVLPNQLALTNGPEVKVEDLAVDKAIKGATKRFSFAKTQPLPTYLVAFAVGEFDVVNAPPIGKVPFRVITTRGKGHLAKYSIKKTPAILNALSDYFGQPYPYAKLDFIAVPNFSAGAMENVGLVTYRETLLLLDEKSATNTSKYVNQSITAHELAHMWFGNLVTPAWWDELWLNESFATWMASRIMEQVFPEFESRISSVRSVERLMAIDSVGKTRAIRQPIVHGGDIYGAFDGITYGKGAATLRMIEAWIGETAFRDGVRTFMKENAHGVVTTPALMAALEKASGKPVYDTLKTFLDQPGVPLLSAELDCKSSAKPALKLSQERYIPAASGAKGGQLWRVPVCVSYPEKGAVQTQCDVLDAKSKTITLEKATSCPAWINPNAQARGYYMWSMPEPAFMRNYAASKNQLTLRERLFTSGVISSLYKAKKISASSHLYLNFETAATTNNHHLLRDTVSTAAGLENVAKEKKVAEKYRAMLRKIYRPHLDRLGLEPKEGEAPGEARLRRSLLGLLGNQAQDPYVIANAKGLLAQFLNKPESVPAWHTSWAISMAAKQGDVALFDALVKLFTTTKNPRVRSTAARALGSFKDPKLIQRAQDMFLTRQVRSSEFWSFFAPTFSDEASFALTWAWFTKNFDPLVEKLGKSRAPRLASLGQGFCKTAKKQQVEAFFKDKVEKFDGMDRFLSMTLESIDRCATQRSLLGPALLEVLNKDFKKTSP